MGVNLEGDPVRSGHAAYTLLNADLTCARVKRPLPSTTSKIWHSRPSWKRC